MDLIVAWVAFPALLAALAGGAGLLVERLGGVPLPGGLVPGVGLAAIVTLAGFLALADATAELIVPSVVGIAAVGAALGRARLRSIDPAGAVAGLAAFAFFAAPVVASGEATFAGYIRLDDTATWLALTDRVMEHGRDLDGLAPSTYEATLAFNLGDGYPIGAFLPLGAGAALTGEDPAWLIQPYMALLGALLALALWELARRLTGRVAAAAIALVASQAALLYGYYLWGGVKEIAAAALLAAFAGVTVWALAAPAPYRRLLTPAIVAGAVIGVLSGAAIAWLLPALFLACLAASEAWDLRQLALRAGAFAGATAVLVLPVLASGGLLPPTSSPLTSDGARGNLFAPLEPAQVAGIWPAGDFRVDPGAIGATYLLVAAAVLAAGLGLAVAWRAHHRAPVAYALGALAAALGVWVLGSPWVDAKALAIASPAIPFAAGLAAALLWGRGFRPAAAALALAIAGGVLWSTALAFRDVSLAPRDQLAELEAIGERIGGEGPTLITEYQPYGARHFLRASDAEGASELRRSRIALRNGDTVGKGDWADTDRLDPAALLAYRTLVLRRSPAQSRPPSPYRLLERGEHYEVWRQDGSTGGAGVRHHGLGTDASPVARPRCELVRELAAAAPPGARLIAAARPAPVAIPLAEASYPPDWEIAGGAEPVPADGVMRARAWVPRASDYSVWLGGSVRPLAQLRVDGELVGEVRHRLNNADLYTRLGSVGLTRGEHELAVSFAGADLHPGSGGAAEPVGPLLLSSAEAADARLVSVPRDRAATRLCGRAWDWIEVVEE